MFKQQQKCKHTVAFKSVNLFVAITFISTSVITPGVSYAQIIPQTVLSLPTPGAMVNPTAGFIPTLIKGITINPENPLNFSFIVDTGDTGIEGEELRNESSKLIKYFFASLTVPTEELWVNLSPYEKDRIIPDKFGQTEMGRDLLAQDYMLKQLTASLMHPDEDLGREFWQRVHKKAKEKYGDIEIPMNTYNKIWIVPKKATILEHENTAYVVKSELEVMLAEDYLALQESIGRGEHGAEQVGEEDLKESTKVTSEVVREILLPEIEKEVNEGKTFSNLRQIYNAMILATWFKVNLKESLLGQIYVNQNKTAGINLDDPTIKEQIYEQYLEAFKKGVYNQIKEEYDPATQEIIPRKYFSGGFSPVTADKATLEEVVIESAIDYDALSRAEQRRQREVLEPRSPNTIFMINADALEETGDGRAERAVQAAQQETDKASLSGTVFKSDEAQAGRVIFGSNHRSGVDKRRRKRVTVQSIQEAQDLLKEFESITEPTPLETIDGVNQFVQRLVDGPSQLRVWLKREDTNGTGSFKDRSPVVFYKRIKKEIADMKTADAIRQRAIDAGETNVAPPTTVELTLKAVSTGNHGRAAVRAVRLAKAYIEKNYPDLKDRFILKAEVTMGQDAKEHKKALIMREGGDDAVRQIYPAGHPKAGQPIPSYFDGENLVLQEIDKDGGKRVMQVRHADADVVSGYGSAAKEIADQLQEQGVNVRDAESGKLVLASPLGSGGFFAGLLELSALNENVKSFGVASSPADLSYRSFEEGRIIREAIGSEEEVMVDGTAATPEPYAVEQISEIAKGVLKVTEKDALYATAILKLNGIEVEPTSGLPLAGVLLHQTFFNKAENIVMPLTSKNVNDATRVAVDAILERGEGHIFEYFKERQRQVKEALDVLEGTQTSFHRLQRTQDKGALRFAVNSRIADIARKYNINIGDNIYSATQVNRSFLKGALRLPVQKQKSALAEYRAFVAANKQIVAGKTLQLASEISDGIYSSTHHLTSFPDDELAAMTYIRTFMADELGVEVEHLSSQVPVMDENLDSDVLFDEHLIPAAKKMLNELAVHEEGNLASKELEELQINPEIRDQVENELIAYFYMKMLQRPSTPKRIIRFSETSSRDGFQSRFKRTPGVRQRAVLNNTLRYGNVYRVETWGGTLPQAALLEDGALPPEDPFYNLRRQTDLLKERLEEVIGIDNDKIDAQDKELLFSRYNTEDPARKLLSNIELDELLERTRLSEGKKEAIRNVYHIRQEMLFRGEFAVGLEPYSSDVLRKFAEVAYKNGMDVFRIFDAFNDLESIADPLSSVRETGGALQPVTHYTKNFSIGNDGYVLMFHALRQMAGDKLDAPVVKDASGLLEPKDAFKLFKRFRDSGVTGPVQLHTHDSRGNRLLTLLEAVRAQGTEDVIVLDVATDYLGVLAQVNMETFLRAVERTNWESGLMKNLNAPALAANKRLIREEIFKGIPIINASSQTRRNMVDVAEQPGGTVGSFYSMVLDQMKILSKAVKNKYGIDIFAQEGQLTKEGRQFIDSIMQLASYEMPRIKQDLGNFGLVTPSSQWVMSQAVLNVLNKWMQSDWLSFDKKTGALSVNSSMPTNRLALYAPTGLQPGLKEYLLKRAASTLDMSYEEIQARFEQIKDRLGKEGRNFRMTQDEVDFLKKYSLVIFYPQVNVDIAFDALKGMVQGLTREDVDERGFIKNKELLKKLHQIKEVIGSRRVDASVAKVYRILNTQGFFESRRELTRDSIIEAIKSEKALKIPPTLGEIKTERDRLQAIYPELSGTDEDLINLAIFPNDKQFPRLLRERAKLREKVQSDPEDLESLIVLERMGVAVVGNGDRASLSAINAIEYRIRSIEAEIERIEGRIDNSGARNVGQYEQDIAGLEAELAQLVAQRDDFYRQQESEGLQETFDSPDRAALTAEEVEALTVSFVTKQLGRLSDARVRSDITTMKSAVVLVFSDVFGPGNKIELITPVAEALLRVDDIADALASVDRAELAKASFEIPAMGLSANVSKNFDKNFSDLTDVEIDVQVQTRSQKITVQLPLNAQVESIAERIKEEIEFTDGDMEPTTIFDRVREIVELYSDAPRFKNQKAVPQWVLNTSAFFKEKDPVRYQELVDQIQAGKLTAVMAKGSAEALIKDMASEKAVTDYKNWMRSLGGAFREKLMLHSNGNIATTISALEEYGILQLLQDNQLVTMQQIMDHVVRGNYELKTPNDGLLHIALGNLVSRGWLKRSGESASRQMTFSLTDKGRAAVKYASLYDKVSKFMPDALRTRGFLRGLKMRSQDVRLQELVELSNRQWDLPQDLDAKLRNEMIHELNGFLVVRFIVFMNLEGILQVTGESLNVDIDKLNVNKLGKERYVQAFQIMANAGFGQLKANVFTFNSVGLQSFEKALTNGVNASYYPTTNMVRTLLFGDPKTIKWRDSYGRELMVERVLNVLGSGAAHSNYFLQVDKIVKDVVKARIGNGKVPTVEELVDSGRAYTFYVADTGSGDGTFLQHLYETIIKDTEYGKLMQEHPELYKIEMIGVDYNADSLDTTSARLRLSNIPHQVIQGDINEPAGILREFRKRGVSKEAVLHVRSFLDHNRPFTGVVDKEAALKRKTEGRVLSTGTFSDEFGRAIPNHELEQNLYEHMKKWAEIADELIIIELHTINQEVAAQHVGETLAISYDLHHGYSFQLTAEAPVFRAMAKEAGWQMDTREGFFADFPAQPDMTTVTIGLFRNTQPVVSVDRAQLNNHFNKTLDAIFQTVALVDSDLAYAFESSLKKRKVLDDLAESVGISAKQALDNMVRAGLVRQKQEQQGTLDYVLTPNFYLDSVLEDFRQIQIASSQNPQAVDLSLVRLERILLSGIDVDKWVDAVTDGETVYREAVISALEYEGLFPTITASWRLNRALEKADAVPVVLNASIILPEEAERFYEAQGVDIDFSLPQAMQADEDKLKALTAYQEAVREDMSRGQFNYRGSGTKQTIAAYYEDSFKKEWFGKIQDYIRAQFDGGKNLKTIVTNGIGANDQFMWSLVEMYNQNRREGDPVWHHIVVTRDLEKIQAGLDPQSTLFINISRSGSTWEGAEITSRMRAKGFNKMIVLANGGAQKEFADAANAENAGVALQVTMQPDIGGRNMHRKTPIYYTAQTVASMFVPSMAPSVFAYWNDMFDKSNELGSESSIATASGQFVHTLMMLKGVEHMAFISNTEATRLIGTELGQYIMEGSNKEHVISFGEHDLTKEDESVLTNLARSPAGKKTMAVVVLDEAASTYKQDKARVEVLKSQIPMIIFTINTSADKSIKGVSVAQQAAFDILWTDFITSLTAFLQVDANSNPNVKVVRDLTASYVSKWRETAERYKTDPIGRKETEVLLSIGYPADSDVGTPDKQVAINSAVDAKRIGQETARRLIEQGLVIGRDRLNIFAGAENLRELVQAARETSYSKEIVTQRGWIVEQGMYPLRAHKGHEATLANRAAAQTKGPLLGDKSINIFLNQRSLGDSPFFNEPFVDTTGKERFKDVNGANVHQTNDSMTFPNIQRTAQVSPTILFEFETLTLRTSAIVGAFYAGLIDELAKYDSETDRAELADANEFEVNAANQYWEGKMTTTPIEGEFRASLKEDVIDVTEITGEEALRLEKIGADAIRRGKGYISMLVAGASSRMNTALAPEDVKGMIDGEILSKAAVPVGEVDGVTKTYLDAFGDNLSRLFASVDAQARQAGLESNVYDNDVGFLSNDAYRAEHDALLAKNGNYGLRKGQVRFFHQPLGAKYVGTPAEVEKLASKFKDEAAYKEALAYSQEVQRRIAAGEKKAAVLPGERDPLGHGEFLHQMVASGELLHIIESGKEFIFTKNVDNYAASFDKVWLRTIGLFIDRGLDFQPEVSPRAPGQKGGILIIKPNRQELAEDPNVKATVDAQGKVKVDPLSAYWLNNAVGTMSVNYVINIYKKPGQSNQEFIDELKAVRNDRQALEAIADRGRQKFPKILDPKPAKRINAVSVKAETNLWQSTGVVDETIKIQAVGVRGARNFPIDQYPSMTPEQKREELAKLRFLATKQWDLTPDEIRKAKQALSQALGVEASDAQVALTLESYRGNELLAQDLLKYIQEAELVTSGIFDRAQLNGLEDIKLVRQFVPLAVLNESNLPALEEMEGRIRNVAVLNGESLERFEQRRVRNSSIRGGFSTFAVNTAKPEEGYKAEELVAGQRLVRDKSSQEKIIDKDAQRALLKAKLFEESREVEEFLQQGEVEKVLDQLTNLVETIIAVKSFINADRASLSVIDVKPVYFESKWPGRYSTDRERTITPSLNIRSDGKSTVIAYDHDNIVGQETEAFPDLKPAVKVELSGGKNNKQHVLGIETSSVQRGVELNVVYVTPELFASIQATDLRFGIWESFDGGPLQRFVFKQANVDMQRIWGGYHSDRDRTVRRTLNVRSNDREAVIDFNPNEIDGFEGDRERVQIKLAGKGHIWGVSSRENERQIVTTVYVSSALFAQLQEKGLTAGSIFIESRDVGRIAIGEPMGKSERVFFKQAEADKATLAALPDGFIQVGDETFSADTVRKAFGYINQKLGSDRLPKISIKQAVGRFVSEHVIAIVGGIESDSDREVLRDKQTVQAIRNIIGVLIADSDELEAVDGVYTDSPEIAAQPGFNTKIFGVKYADGASSKNTIVNLRAAVTALTAKAETAYSTVFTDEKAVESAPLDEPSGQPDRAALTPVGGIDLNPDMLDLEIIRDGNGIPLPLPQQPIDNMHIEGFLPVIIEIIPVTNLPLLLGMAETEDDSNISFDKSLDPSKPVERADVEEVQSISYLK